ncbi:MAG: hypothetical protein J7M34_03585 [Anaerolineae bacterium]|nr:hypothetical protein [Anaerolineae bacterium]
MLAFPRLQMESGFTVPDRDLAFRLVNFDHLPDDPNSGPAILVQAFQAGQGAPVASWFVTTDTTLTVGNARYILRLTRSVVLTAAHDPGALIVLLGGVLVCLGYAALALGWRGSLPRLALMASVLAALAAGGLAFVFIYNQWKLGCYALGVPGQRLLLAVTLIALAWQAWTWPSSGEAQER